jgi:hypothetical protein
LAVKEVSQSDLDLIQEAQTNGKGIALDLTDALDVVREESGYATLYDQRTGEPSTVRLYEGDKTLRQYLAKRDADGNVVFGVRKPRKVANVSDVPCWLNKLSGEYDYFFSIGLVPSRPCTKMLHNDTELRSHMENAHPDEYQAKVNQEAAEKAERSLNREELMAQALIALAKGKE